MKLSKAQSNKILINKKFGIGKKIENFYKNLSWNQKKPRTFDFVQFLQKRNKPITLSKNLQLGIMPQSDVEDIEKSLQTQQDNLKNDFNLELSTLFFPFNAAGPGILSYDSSDPSNNYGAILARNRLGKQRNKPFSSLSNLVKTIKSSTSILPESDHSPESAPSNPETADNDNVLLKPSNIFQSILTKYLRLPLSLSSSPNFVKDVTPPSQIDHTQTSYSLRENNRLHQKNQFVNYLQNTLPFLENILPSMITQKYQRDISTPSNIVTRDLSFLPSEIFHLLNFSYIPNNIKIQTGSFANKITKHHKADALTLNETIFLSNDYENVYSPESIALIGHELTHIQQQQETENLGKPITPLRRTILEKQALRNEQIILDYLFRYKKSGFGKLPKFKKPSTNLSNQFQKRPISKFKTSGSTLELSLPINFESVNFESADSFENSDHVLTTKYPTPFALKQPESSPNSSLHGVQSEISTPELHYSHPSPQITNTPMTASEDRDLNSSLNDNLSTENNVTAESSSYPPLDYEAIAEIVYQLLKENIKTQRERRGY